MANQFKEEKIREWLDSDIVQEVEKVQDQNAVYNLMLNVSDMPIHVIWNGENEPVKIVTQVVFDPETLALIFDMDRERRNFLTQLSSVLTNAPGAYSFLDGAEESCSFQEMRMIRLEYRIYEDGMSQQRLMDGITNLATSSVYINHAANNLRENIENRT